MKITGTKKFFIILFSLACALAAGSGIFVARSAYRGNAVLAAFAEESTSQNLAGESEEQSPTAVNIGDEIAEQINCADEQAEQQPVLDAEYDERFDESVIGEVARLSGNKIELVRLYCRVKQIDARELLERLVIDRQLTEEYRAKEEEKQKALSKSHNDENIASPDEADGYSNDSTSMQSHNFDDTARMNDDLFAFQTQYMEGEIALDESAKNTDWYIAPDELSQYAQSRRYVGYLWGTFTSRIGYTWDNSKVKYTTIHHPAQNPQSDDVTGYNFGVRPDILYWTYYVELDWGESYTIRRPYQGSVEPAYYLCNSYIGNKHFSYTESAYVLWYGDSTFVVDGDAPTGTYFEFYVFYNRDPNNRWWHYMLTWYNNGGYNYYVDTNSTHGSFNTRSCAALGLRFMIKRKDPPSPKIVVEAGVDASTNTKTAFYEGAAVTISMTNDAGSPLIAFSADSTVEVASRSMHGMVKNSVTTGSMSNIVFQCYTAGTHVIRLRLVPAPTPQIAWPGIDHTESPSSSGATMISTMPKWSDDNSSEISFTLVIQLQTTPKPKMVRDAGVDGMGRTKTVSYTGSPLTVSFSGADKRLLVWASNGLTESSWDDAGNLVLQGTTRGTYTITILLKNSAACKWSDGSTDAVQFTFIIKEMAVDKPTQVGDPSLEHKVNYSGNYEIMKIAPCVDGQLMIIAPGVEYTHEANNEVFLKMVNAGSVNIIVMPAEGYIWKDNTKTPITFTFTIVPTPVTAPRLRAGDGVDLAKGRKSIVFDPTPGWHGELVIENISPNAININTAMAIASWGTDNVLTLQVANANTYPVTFTLKSTNYQWDEKVQGNVPRFELFIDRYQLDLPKIMDEEYANGYVIPGELTKTVYYNTDSAKPPYTAKADKYFKLFAGGVTSIKQVEIRYSQVGLREVWDDSGAPNLTLWATTASGADGPSGNYIINITPTSNYMWKDKTNDMKTYKFVVTPIGRDFLPMYQESDSGNAWILVGGDRMATFNYDGKDKKFRIGNVDDSTLYYTASQMEYQLVDQSFKPVKSTDANFPEHYKTFDARVETVGSATVLQCKATAAGTYIVRMRLKDNNFAWRDGSGVDIYYTLTIRAQSIANPVLQGDECKGHNLQTYDTYVHGGYDGNLFQMVIGISQIDKNGKDIIKIYTNPYKTDIDPDTQQDAIWKVDWTAGSEEDVGRLYFAAKIVGVHKVWLVIDDPNYKWETDCEYYEFTLDIDYAEVDDVSFAYGLPDEATPIGGNGSTYSAEFAPDGMHHITVTRSTDEFKTTPFKTQFTATISYGNPAYTAKSETFSDGNLVIDFYDANIYYVNIYLTSNYRWKRDQRQDTPVQLIFEITPKFVNLPDIVTEKPTDAVDNALHTKTVIYDTQTIQSIALNLGNDYKAFAIDENQNTKGLKKDTTIVTSQHKKFRYTARDAGTYNLALVLSDTNNYTWLGADVVLYTLEIEQRAISVPDVFWISSANVTDTNQDYLDIKAQTTGSEALVPDSNDEYRVTKSYDGLDHYIYLFGYALENDEVIITVTPKDTTNADGVDIKSVQTDSKKHGNYVAARLVNEYVISVAFKLNSTFNIPNCHWQNVSMGTDNLPREFILEIEKKVVDLPYLVADPSQSWAQDNSINAHFTYSEAAPWPYVEIANCLSSTSEAPFMFYFCDEMLMKKVRNASTNILNLSILSRALVDQNYRLTIKLNEKNERWNTSAADDIDDRYVDIIIDKKTLTKPTLVNEGEAGATYNANGLEKSFDFNGSARPNAMKINGVTGKMVYSTVDKTNSSIAVDGNNDLVLSISTFASGTYSLKVEINDTKNYTWAVPAGDPADNAPITFSVVIVPSKIAMPEIDVNACTLLSGANHVSNVQVETTYYIDYTVPNSSAMAQTIAITNFPFNKPLNTVTIEIATANGAKHNLTASRDEGLGLLYYTASQADTYTITFSLSANVAWDDGTAYGSKNDVVITFVIHKSEYTPLTIKDVTGDTKTVVYNFNKQLLEIADFNGNVMNLVSTTPDDRSLFESKGPVTDTTATPNVDYFTFEAKDVGEYVARFELLDPANECWTGLNVTYLEFKLVIDKLKIKKPIVDNTAAGDNFYLTGETRSSDTKFTVTYDKERHSVLVLNVLDTNYMTFAPAANYNTTISDKFMIDSVAQAESKDSLGNYLTVPQVFGNTKNGTFADNTVSVSSDVIRQNYILMQATEPGTYEVIFKLKDSKNLSWDDGSAKGIVADQKVTFFVDMINLLAPTVKAGTSTSLTYSGGPLQFYIDEAQKGTANIDYLLTPSIKYLPDPSKTAMVVKSWNGKVIEFEATQIGTYEVTLTLANTTYVKWSNLATPFKTFTFNINKSALTPTISFGNAKYHTVVPTGSQPGDPDVNTNTALANGATRWVKSSTVTARITFPNIKPVMINGNEQLDVEGVAFEVYYKTAAKAGVKLNFKSVTVPDSIKTAATTLTFPPSGGPVQMSGADSTWWVERITSSSGNLYTLYYDYEILPDANYCYKPEGGAVADYTLYKASYTLCVDHSSATPSNSYTIADASKAFTIDADPAPFTTGNADDYIIWQVYLASNTTTPLKTYKLSDFAFPNSKWSDMAASFAISLPYLESDSYVFRAYFDATGLIGPDTTAAPATDFKEALLRWEVKWNGVYGGTPNAKYATKLTASSAPVEVNFALTENNSNAYSYPGATFKFFYHITPILYDLKGVVWDYSGTPFTYDGLAKSVKLTGLPTGLSVASYDPAGDRNVQTSAKSQAEHGAKYHTTAIFTSSDPNYMIPRQNDATTYKDTGTTAFKWSVDWEIVKAKLSVQWNNTKSEDGKSSVYVPILMTHGDKVNYTYFKDDGTGSGNHANWPAVTTFDHTGTVDFKVLATLKSNPADPALDFANNYYLEFPLEPVITDRHLIFTLGPSTKIAVNLTVGNLDANNNADLATFKALTAGITPTATQNTFVYCGKAFVTNAPGAPLTLIGAPSTITVENNVVITYYNTINKFRPIPEPDVPGHYLIKLQLKNLPEDGVAYELAMTEFYFDIEKGTIDPNSYYWRYTHTDTNNKEYVAIYDFTQSKWLIHHTGDSVKLPDGTYTDPAGLASPEIGKEITEFVYDSKSHTVELYSEDPTVLAIITQNKSATNAGNYTSKASFSYNGKLWKAPVINDTFPWKIEKATISLANVQWSNFSNYVYTVSGGQTKSYDMTISGIDPLLVPYTSYITQKTNLAGFDPNTTDKTKNITLPTSLAGTYVTKFIIDEKTFNKGNANYQLGTDWPSSVPNPLQWEIARREFEVPSSNGTWLAYDGQGHDLLSALNLTNDWFEYFTITVKYKPLADKNNNYPNTVYSGITEFGNETFAGNAGYYQFTFTLIEDLNKIGEDTTNENVVWKISNGIGYDYPTTDQTCEMEIAKASMTVVSWNANDEASTANLSGNYVSDLFVDYEYYENNAAAPAISKGNDPIDLTDVLTITADKEFVIKVVVRQEYTANVEIIGGNTEFAFKMQAPSNALADQQIVARAPYIAGTIRNGVEVLFTEAEWKQMFIDDQQFGLTVADKDKDDDFWAPYLNNPVMKAKVKINVTYDNAAITFFINEWETGATYKNHLNIWQGDLTQNAAGEYSVTFLFKKDLVNPRCWGDLDSNGAPKVDTNGNPVATAIDRSPITLKFNISYRMIRPHPYVKELATNPLALEKYFPTYMGSELDILKTLWGDDHDAWLQEYGKYFTVEGNNGTDAGGYTLVMKIRDEYLNTVHWDNDTVKGQPGTYKLKWSILPIYVAEPVLGSAPIYYDGNDHSVVEVLIGYAGVDNMTAELKDLIQYATITGGNGVDADSYHAFFTLPNANYAWKTAIAGGSSTVAPDKSLKRELGWTINPQELDISNIAWDYTKPFKFSYENGAAEEFEVKLIGIDEKLNQYITYSTRKVSEAVDAGTESGLRSDIGNYITVAYFFKDDVKSKNYKLVTKDENKLKEFLAANSDPDGFGYTACTWKIEQRRYTPPADLTVDFSGTLRDIMEDEDMFAFEKGWENYLDVTIEYKPLGADDTKYVSYFDMASADELLEYSMFNVFYIGTYRLKMSVKNEFISNKNVVWFSNGNTSTVVTAKLTLQPCEISVTGWTDTIPDTTTGLIVSATLDSVDFNALSDESKALFKYIVRDKATGEEITTSQEIIDAGKGIYYTVEFVINDTESYAAKYGFQFVWNTVPNPYEFINKDFGAQPLMWLPKPSFTATPVDTYDGNAKVYSLNGWSVYDLTPTIQTTLANYNVTLDPSETKLVKSIGKNKDLLIVDDGTVTVTKAGEYDILLRLMPNVNLSWFDPALYEVVNGKLCHKGTTTLLTAAELAAVEDRNAQTLKITIKKASVPQITPDMLKLYESMIPSFDYTGIEYNLRTLNQTKPLFDLLKSTYGNLIDFEGYAETVAGEHTLVIKLKDPESSYWNLNVKETIIVNNPESKEYDSAYKIEYVKEGGKWVIKYVKDDGKGGRIDYNNGDYKVDVVYKFRKLIESYVLADGLLDADGKPLDATIKYETDANGVAIRYALSGGNYVVAADGTYIAKYKLKQDGSIVEMPEIDKEGRTVIDTEKTAVKITRVKTSTDPYEINWYITASKVAAPTVNPNIVLHYNGSEQSVEAVLKGYNSTYMEIVEGGKGKNADEYIAKIRLTNESYSWRDTTDEFVYVTWHIEKTTVDLTGVKWKFTDGTNTYKDGNGMVYTRKDGKAVIYWVELENLPLIIRDAVKFTTNGVTGAYAGRDAGKYITSFEISDPDSNFESIIYPDGLSKSVEWSIARRRVEVPVLNSQQYIFDDEAHDLLSALTLPADWEEYMTVQVWYASNFIAFVEYEGYNGNPFEAHGAGAYKFVVSIKDGINTNKNNPCVVWAEAASSATPAPASEVSNTPKPVAKRLADVAEQVVKEAAEQPAVKVAEVPTVQRSESKVANVAVREVCDTIKRIVYCTDRELSFRKSF